MVLLVSVGQSLRVPSELFVDLLSAKALLLNWIGMCLGKPALGRAALCSKDDLRVAEVLAAHLQDKANGGPGVFQPSGERYRLRRRAEAMMVFGESVSSGSESSSDMSTEESPLPESEPEYIEFPPSD